MTNPHPKRLVRPATVTALALLAAGLLTAAPARAGCVHPAGAVLRDGGVGHFDRLARAGALARPDSEPGGLPGVPSGCPGGSCSRDESRPPAPAPGSWQVETRDVLATAPPAVAGPGPAAAPAAEGRPRPVHRARSVFHPPPLSH